VCVLLPIIELEIPKETEDGWQPGYLQVWQTDFMSLDNMILPKKQKI
jgi:hypothetical protein